jgi:predicted chitinase
MIPYTRDQLLRLAPLPARASETKRQIYAAYVDAIASDAGFGLIVKYGIRSPLEFCHFMAQITHETGGFTVVEEASRYSAERIVEIFGPGRHSARIDLAEARKLAGNGPALFERAYGVGNPKMATTLGNADPGDGWKYRGRGPMQTTGRGDYRKFGAKIGFDLEGHPELLEQPIVGLEAAAWEWREKGCSRWALEDNVAMVTRRINGGHNGLDDRIEYLAKAKSLWLRTLPQGLQSASPAASTTPASPQSSFNTIVAKSNDLAPGEQGPRVRILQGELKRLGYYLLEPDGDFGDRTIEALLAFKHANALSLDDKVDDSVWSALRDGRPRDLGQRAHTTEQDLRDKGSTEIADADLFQRIAVWFGLGTGGTAAAQKVGLTDQLKSAGDNASAMKIAAGQIADALSFAAHNIVPIALIGISVALLIYARKNKRRRVALARSGQHLGR